MTAQPDRTQANHYRMTDAIQTLLDVTWALGCASTHHHLINWFALNEQFIRDISPYIHDMALAYARNPNPQKDMP